MLRYFLAALAVVTTLTASPAVAQETIDIGMIRNEDVAVVQQLLYPKAGRVEIGLHAGVMPFDAYLTTPNGQFSWTQHLSERVGLSLVAGAGYGLKSGVYRELESPTFGVAPFAYRYLGSALVGLEYAPIYAKLNFNGARVIHFDVYFPLRGGLTVESSVIPDGGLAFAPTVSPGIGMRFFLGKVGALKFEIRDDLLLQYRSLTESFEFKQNANVTLGITLFSGKGK
ncbi:MAG: outer membrane beta-barrel domain-containing protein [Myxococcales bacterium]|nr:outer membrane beta-barrel domain-containing protein [Myxococcales bacterium]